MVVLMNLLMSWWKVDEFPFPRTSTLAKRIGVTTRTIQRNVESLEQKKLIKRIWRKSDKSDARAAASYDLSGIVAELKRLGSVG
jgi:DNA-binding MarR family transcriptional regulator